VTGPEDAFGKQMITVAAQIIRFESIQLLLVGDTTRQNWCEQPMFLARNESWLGLLANENT